LARFPDLDRLAQTVWEALRDRMVLVLLGAAFGGALVLVSVVAWETQPDRFMRGYSPEQPIPFSHRVHAGQMNMPCLYCHYGAQRSRHAGIPPAETCMNCHRVTKTDSPAIVQLAALYDSDRPIPWQRIHRLPDFVFFDHRPHVASGIQCQTCHGEVQSMATVYQFMSLRMSNCLACHRDPRAALPAGSSILRGPEDCDACHR